MNTKTLLGFCYLSMKEARERSGRSDFNTSCIGTFLKTMGLPSGHILRVLRKFKELFILIKFIVIGIIILNRI